LIELLHWVTAVTGLVRVLVVVVQAAVGSPAAPWHSRTVTFADPPLAVIVLTTVTWQIRPLPPGLSTPLLHVVVVAIVAAVAPPANAREPTSNAPTARRMLSERGMEITCSEGSATEPVRRVADRLRSSL
jgi:hypothetical protein